MTLTPRQSKMLAVINTGPWPFGVSDLMDDDFHVLLAAKLIVLRDDHGRGHDYVDTTSAGERLADQIAAAARKDEVQP